VVAREVDPFLLGERPLLIAEHHESGCRTCLLDDPALTSRATPRRLPARAALLARRCRERESQGLERRDRMPTGVRAVLRAGALADRRIPVEPDDDRVGNRPIASNARLDGLSVRGDPEGDDAPEEGVVPAGLTDLVSRPRGQVGVQERGRGGNLGHAAFLPRTSLPSFRRRHIRSVCPIEADPINLEARGERPMVAARGPND
jgi:hypothetical protein